MVRPVEPLDVDGPASELVSVEEVVEEEAYLPAIIALLGVATRAIKRVLIDLVAILLSVCIDR